MMTTTSMPRFDIERYDVLDQPGRPVMAMTVAHGDWVSTCLTASDRSADAAGQTREILAAIERNLHAAGASRQTILTAQLWVREEADLPAVVALWNAWVDAASPPTCSLVRAALARPDILVEIKVSAARALRA